MSSCGNRVLGSAAGGRHPFILRWFATASQLRDRCPGHARPNSRRTSSVALTREVIVTRVLCGVDVSSESLAARIGQDGAEASFANSPQGIAALAGFCRMH